MVAHDLLEYKHMDDVCLGKLVLLSSLHIYCRIAGN